MTCQHCNEPLGYYRSKFCRNSCRVAHYLKVLREATIRHCIICGAELGRQNKFCSKACQLAHRVLKGQMYDHCSVCGEPKPTTTSTRCRVCWKPASIAHHVQIISDYDAGLKCADIARKYGLSRERIRQIIKKAGRTMPRDPSTKVEMEAA
jgi:predicted nucleic acid-binding Zn ribbon protein